MSNPFLSESLVFYSSVLSIKLSNRRCLVHLYSVVKDHHFHTLPHQPDAFSVFVDAYFSRSYHLCQEVFSIFFIFLGNIVYSIKLQVFKNVFYIYFLDRNMDLGRDW